MEKVINREKISRFSSCALRPTLGAFLRDISSKIAEIQQCSALGTTLQIDTGILLNSINPDQIALEGAV